MNANPFILFGTTHIVTIIAITLVSIFLPLIYKTKSEYQKSIMTKAIAFVIFCHVIISPYKDLYLLDNPYNWREVLPFHMCDLSEIFLIFFLLGGPSILYKCAFFWGLAGATMAIITPDIEFLDLDYAFFMIGHGMIIIGIMYATVALNNRPYAKDIVTVSLITALILLPITYLINYILGEPANFWYLMQKPAGASLMDAFPEPPYHLLVTTPLAILMFCLIYIPYYVKDRAKS
ncbi:TIGR02206 family membrane protein [Gammaproteobacteria bacterium]|nr:TIGR02206 family membrane protein [Gammaproteobacteria bacterium]